MSSSFDRCVWPRQYEHEWWSSPGSDLETTTPLGGLFPHGAKRLDFIHGVQFCFVHSFFNIFYSGMDTPDQNGQWYQHLQTLFAFFFLYASNTEGTNFRIMFICVMFVKCACFVLYSFLVRLDLVKSPEVTQCGEDVFIRWSDPFVCLSVHRARHCWCCCRWDSSTRWWRWLLYSMQWPVPFV